MTTKWSEIKRRKGAPPVITRWVLTLFPSDSGPLHIIVFDEEEGRDLLSAIAAGRKMGPPPVPFDLREVPATWQCDGRDGCMEQA